MQEYQEGYRNFKFNKESMQRSTMVRLPLT